MMLPVTKHAVPLLFVSAAVVLLTTLVVATSLLVRLWALAMISLTILVAIVVIALDQGLVEVRLDAFLTRRNLFPLRVYITGEDTSVLAQGIFIRRSMPYYEELDPHSRLQCYCIPCQAVVVDMLHCRRCHMSEQMFNMCPNCNIDEPVRQALEDRLRRRLPHHNAIFENADDFNTVATQVLVEVSGLAV